MASVFISHAHSDELLAEKVAALLGDALGLTPADFFLSSQEGRGVAPSASIRAEVLKELSAAPALIVLLTPISAESPWVWLEAGNRLGRPDRTSPLFVVPSGRFVSLLQPVADLRCLQLDNDGELHELVQAVGKSLGKPPLDFLIYKPALNDLIGSTRRAYSPRRQKTAQVVSWLKGHVAALLLVALGLLLLGYSSSRIASANAAAELDHNTGLSNTAARYLILKGRVVSGSGNIPDAAVMASRDRQVRDPATCQEPQCTSTETTTEGGFTIDLTRIKAENGDDIVLSVVQRDYAFFSENVTVDVRAMDVRATPKTVTLASRPSPPSPRP